MIYLELTIHEFGKKENDIFLSSSSIIVNFLGYFIAAR